MREKRKAQKPAVTHFHAALPTITQARRSADARKRNDEWSSDWLDVPSGTEREIKELLVQKAMADGVPEAVARMALGA